MEKKEMKALCPAYFFVDAETDGLYGKFLSVAALVTDQSGNELDRFYIAVKTKKEDLRSEWVKQNVFPFLSEADSTVATEEELLESFWAFWTQYREKCIAIAHVQYPVEARLFSSCVAKDHPAREYLAPFPLYDLSTLLAAKGYDFDGKDFPKNTPALPPHNAINDVIEMAKIWCALF